MKGSSGKTLGKIQCVIQRAICLSFWRKFEAKSIIIRRENCSVFVDRKIENLICFWTQRFIGKVAKPLYSDCAAPSSLATTATASGTGRWTIQFDLSGPPRIIEVFCPYTLSVGVIAIDIAFQIGKVLVFYRAIGDPAISQFFFVIFGFLFGIGSDGRSLFGVGLSVLPLFNARGAASGFGFFGCWR